MQINEHSPYSVIIEKDGNKYIGFLSISNRKNEMAGWIVNDKTIESWEPQGIIEFEKKKYVYGPFFDGLFLEEEIDTLQIEDIHSLSDALLRLPDSFGLSKLHSYGIMKGSNEFLILPQFTISNFSRLTTFEQRFKHYDCYNSPDKLQKPFSFSFSVLVYKSICRCMPFPAEDSSDYFRKLGNYKVIAPNLHKPELKKEVSKAVLQGIKRKNPVIDLQNWKYQLGKWKEDGIFRDINEEEKSYILKQKAKLS